MGPVPTISEIRSGSLIVSFGSSYWRIAGEYYLTPRWDFLHPTCSRCYWTLCAPGGHGHRQRQMQESAHSSWSASTVSTQSPSGGMLVFPLLLTKAYIPQRLDFPLDPQYKPLHVKLLLKLSKVSGLHPECLDLNGVEVEGHPVDRGSYGDVYKGRLHGQVIAVKALRIYQTSNLTKLRKVPFKYRRIVNFS